MKTRLIKEDIEEDKKNKNKNKISTDELDAFLEFVENTNPISFNNAGNPIRRYIYSGLEISIFRRIDGNKEGIVKDENGNIIFRMQSIHPLKEFDSFIRQEIKRYYNIE